MRILFLTFFLLISIISAFSAEKDAYSIEIKVKGFSNEQVILGHYYNKQMRASDTTMVDESGFGVFKGSSPLPQGMYIIYSATRGYFELIMGANQHFRIETDTANYVLNFKVENSLENQIFSDFQHFMIIKSEELKKVSDELNNAKNAKEKEKHRNDIRKLTDERTNEIKRISSEYPDLFISTFLLASLDVGMPDIKKMEDEGKDTIAIGRAVYKYQKDHYFDHFDVGDARLLRTPIYQERILNYLEKYIPQIPDTIIVEVDKIIERSRADSNTFQFVMINLFNHYGKSNIMGFDAVQVHIADKYYIKEAWWSDDKYINDLKERVAILNPLLLGKTAPDVQLRSIPDEHFKVAQNDSLLKRYPHAGQFFNISDVKADFTVLAFWEADCGHCKKSIPQLHKIYVDTLAQMNVKVVAISTLFGEDGKEKWIDFVNYNKLYGWINAWNPYDYQFKITYDVRSTPQFFILNKEKVIIGKRIGPENVVDLINAYKNHKIQ